MKQAKRNNLCILFISVSLFLTGCSKEKIPEEILVKVYVENLIIEETYASNSDSLQTHKKLVFDKYIITEKEFHTELSKYSEDKARWESFFKKANEYLNDLKKSNAIN